MIVCDFDFIRISILPSDTNTFVNPDAVLPLPVTMQPLQFVARRNGQFPKVSHAIYLIELPAGNRP
jgi:hypothetical protein